MTIFEEAKAPDVKAETERRPAVVAEALVVQSEVQEKYLPSKVGSMIPFEVKQVVEAAMVLYSVALPITVFEKAKKHLEIF